jgi:hypothetical protein
VVNRAAPAYKVTNLKTKPAVKWLPRTSPSTVADGANQSGKHDPFVYLLRVNQAAVNGLGDGVCQFYHNLILGQRRINNLSMFFGHNLILHSTIM